MTKHLVLLQNKDLKSIEKNQGTLKQQGQTGFFVSSDSIVLYNSGPAKSTPVV